MILIESLFADAMPWISTRTGQEINPNVWPLPDDAFAHPRSAGTFTRFLAQYVRDRQLISWPDAIAKTSYLPAKLLEETTPQMKKKGRLQVGMDADITVFDPETVEDRATYERPNQTSVGVKYVLVNGNLVIRDGELDANAFPGFGLQPQDQTSRQHRDTWFAHSQLRGRSDQVGHAVPTR
jgi:N-acyl-D-glutamate deacylase